jgi:hypothetical protein
VTTVVGELSDGAIGLIDLRADSSVASGRPEDGELS